MFLRGFASLVSLALIGLNGVLAFDLTRKDNLAVYWGQNGAGSQKNLAAYCADSTIDVIPLAFLYIFRGTGGVPVMDFGSACADWNSDVFPGTDLIKCPSIAADIKTCQSKGKIVTLSLGGATGQVGFSSDSQAQQFADQIWNMFLGGSSSTRPFGTSVLDGVDLDIESGGAAHYAAFVNQLRSHFNGASKKFFITAAPQCPFPDASIGDALNGASFDAVYVQFYNNFCGLNHASDYNFATWDNWAKTKSPNKNVKVYIGAPGSPDAAGDGYVSSSTLANFAAQAQKQFSSFGGVMLWDADTAFTNNRFDKAIKTAIVSSGQQFAAASAPHHEGTSAPAATVTHAASKPPAAPAHTSAPQNQNDDDNDNKNKNNDNKDNGNQGNVSKVQAEQAPHDELKQEPRRSYSRFFRSGLNL
ncbi:glycoside hydrolase [Cristinia sonorae]|uniref:chitinase n=1 Tax=Cristinia sonorae TaxID=1940300 RepID=A0A8K0UDI5_9AGAR|nr:glycoside hydrolase [Cristinia sonorae]